MYHNIVISAVTWGGLSVNLLSILGVLNPLIGAIAGICVIISQYFKWKKEKHGVNIEYLKEEMEKLKLEDYKRKHNKDK